MSRQRTPRILAEYAVLRDGARIGTVEREYQGPTGIPGFVAHEPGRVMYRFLLDEPRPPESHPAHGRFYRTLREVKTDLEPCMVEKVS